MFIDKNRSLSPAGKEGGPCRILVPRLFFRSDRFGFIYGGGCNLRLSRMPGPLGQVRAMALPGKFERNRGGEAMNRAKGRVLWARISPIQAISLLLDFLDGP